MKTNKILSFILMLVVAITMTSCVQDDDYSVPNSLGEEENVALTNMLATATEVDMAYVKGLYDSDPNNDGDFDDAIPYLIENDIYVKGYVSSSDQTGNFFKEFYIQDSPSNPTSALKIILEQVDSYNQFNFGREVYISLKGLYIGEERTGNGIFTIGGGTEFDLYGGVVTRVNQNQIGTNILRSQVTEEVIPLTVTFSEITDQHVGLFVQVDGVEFASNLNGLRYFDPVQVFDTQRTMQACSGFGYSEFQLETSSFATFKEHLLPTENGSIKAVVSKTFDGSARILALNNVTDVNMQSTRCTPLNIEDFEVVFEDGFDIGISNWSTYNALGAQVWEDADFGNPAPSAYMNGFQNGAQNNEDWLISSAIDLSSVTNTIFFFETDKRYNGNDLEVYYSTDYTGGDPNTDGTWTQVDAIIDPNANAWNTWTNSGDIDISAADGQTSVYIAFKYTSDTSAASTFELDNVTVLGL